MTLPEEVHSRLRARAVTDPDLAKLLEIATKGGESLRECSQEPIGDAEIPRL